MFLLSARQSGGSGNTLGGGTKIYFSISRGVSPLLRLRLGVPYYISCYYYMGFVDGIFW